MSTTTDEQTPIRKAVQGLSGVVAKETHECIVEALYSEFNNHGYTLEGNTEETDIVWYAKQIYQVNKIGSVRWDSETEEEKKVWLKLARTTLDILPNLMSRRANRAIAYSREMHAILEGIWAERREKHRGRPYVEGK